jgi:hypothetical protein
MSNSSTKDKPARPSPMWSRLVWVRNPHVELTESQSSSATDSGAVQVADFTTGMVAEAADAGAALRNGIPAIVVWSVHQSRRVPNRVMLQGHRDSSACLMTTDPKMGSRSASGQLSLLRDAKRIGCSTLQVVCSPRVGGGNSRYRRGQRRGEIWKRSPANVEVAVRGPAGRNLTNPDGRMPGPRRTTRPQCPLSRNDGASLRTAVPALADSTL